MKYVFDLDGTLCTNTNGDYINAQPFKERIGCVNRLYDEEHQIIIHTARGMGTGQNNQITAMNKYYSLTEKQLDGWGIKYHYLILGKPAADIYVDDKGVNDNEFFKRNTP